MKLLIRACLMLLLWAITKDLNAQNAVTSATIDTTQVYRVSVKDGSVYVGVMLFRDANKLVMKTAAIPRIEIPVLEVIRIEEVRKTEEVKFGKTSAACIGLRTHIPADTITGHRQFR